MSLVMRLVWIYFLLRKKLGLAKIGQPPRSPAKPSKKQLQGLSLNLEIVDGFKLYRVSPETASKSVVYLHGGGYVQPIAKQHWDAITQLARVTNSEFVVPCYGLSPRYKVSDALLFLEKVRESLDSSKKTILMGDSAGGGLALALAQTTWRDIEALVLISPWVDSEFGEETKIYEARDPWLNANSLRYIATVWSGVGDFRRAEVSPLRADVGQLPRTSIYAGDYELFFPDLEKLHKKMMDARVAVTMHRQPGGLHVYPLIPSPEGKRALKQIAIDIKGS